MIDNGYSIPDPKRRPPLQFKRATFRTFNKSNPTLMNGEPAYEWDTHRLKVGDGHTCYRRLPYISDPKDGKSAYEHWIDAGNHGTIEDFLDSLIGPDGKSAYEIWLSIGHEGTILDFINDIKGDSAYQVWLDAGNEGSIKDFLDSLIGKSAYDIWIGLGNEGTEQDFIDSLVGKSAYQVWLDEGHEGTPDDFINFMCTMSWGTI